MEEWDADIVKKLCYNTPCVLLERSHGFRIFIDNIQFKKLFIYYMLASIVSLSQKFISIKSIPSNPKGLEKILELALAQVKDFKTERFEKNGVKSALVFNGNKRPKKFKIILNAHLDVIPGKEEQYIPYIKGSKLYGVGSMDMKANAACLIMAFKEVAKLVEYPLALQLTTDEEIGGFDGTKYQVEKGVRADFILAGEPTNFDIVHKAKGVLWLKIFAPGKTAHGAYPWRGINAIWEMNSFLNNLKITYPIATEEKWITTINLSNIETNNAVFNKIPDNCIIGLDIRFIPEDAKTIVKKIKMLLPKGFKLKIIANEPALFTPQDNSFVQLLKSIGKDVTKKNISLRGAQGTSDARHFSRVQGSGIEFGPIGKGIGSDREWVSIPSLEKYFYIMKNFLKSIK